VTGSYSFAAGHELAGASDFPTSAGEFNQVGSGGKAARSDHSHRDHGKTLVFTVAGTVSAGAGGLRIPNATGSALTIRAVQASVGTAPTGASLIVDVNKNGTTIFTTQANRPTIAAAGNTSGKVTNMDVTSLADGDYLTVDVDQVGSGTPGSNLTVLVELY
jgi:hypothetical protein